MSIVENASCAWPRNLQQLEREKHGYKTYLQRWAQEVKERKHWESSTNGGGKKILQGLRGFRCSGRGSSITLRDTATTLSEKPSPTQILQCLLKDCARCQCTRQSDRGGSSVSPSAEACNWRGAGRDCLDNVFNILGKNISHISTSTPRNPAFGYSYKLLN